MEIQDIVKGQREYFNTHVTFDLNNRICTLKKIKSRLLEYKDKIYDAFRTDLNKSEFDVDATELGLLLHEIDFMIKHIKKLARPKRVGTSLINFISSGYRYPEPYGVTLVVAPWNYPLQLSLIPLVDSIACGNTVVLKPSNYTPSVAAVIKEVLSCFDEKYIAVVLGGREQNQQLFEQKFDFIFFTGGPTVGKLLMEKASKNLTPCCLELGGKSPCIVHKYSNIDLIAKRVVWGKFLNAGQTCVAPDHILVEKSVKDAFIESAKKWVDKFYYIVDENGNKKLTGDFPYVVNDKHCERLKGLIVDDKVVCGNEWNGRQLSPTIMDNVEWGDAVMQEEIFGPIMPILTYESLDEVVEMMKDKDKPLACYIYGCKKKEEKYLLKNISFGGGCVNDCIMHLTEEALPFGGVGNSGMGSYHGKKSFETFSHYKSVLKKSNKVDLPIRYMPYTKTKSRLLRFIFGIK